MSNPFTAINSTFEADLLNDAYQAITKANAWDFVRDFDADGGFMFSSDPKLTAIQKHMACLDDHSGASYGIIMRNMQYIARNGLEAFLDARKN